MTDTLAMSLATNNTLDPNFAAWSEYLEVSVTPDGRIVLSTYGGAGVTSEGAMTDGSHLLQVDIDCSATPASYQISADGATMLTFVDTEHPNGFRDAQFVGMSGGMSQGAATAVTISINTPGSIGGS